MPQYWPGLYFGETGTGAVWGDGDLNYTVAVSGHVFTETGGDKGDIVGSFFGANHEGMGGTLERSDLLGSFGGTRNQSGSEK